VSTQCVEQIRHHESACLNNRDHPHHRRKLRTGRIKALRLKRVRDAG
jgi:hypothetical protein